MSIGEFAKEIEKMEDRYLFKAKRADNGEWVTGYYTKSIVNGSVFGYIRESIFGTDIKIMLNTLCQCTGLKDKNGKLIWKNDIMKYQLDGKTRIYVVKYEPPMFSYKNVIRCSLYQDEVIGNIFDNPELLESEE